MNRRNIQHSLERALGRYGVALALPEQQNLVQKVMLNDASCLVAFSQIDNRIVVIWKHEPLWMPFVFDCEEKAIVTILPIEALTECLHFGDKLNAEQKSELRDYLIAHGLAVEEPQRSIMVEHNNRRKNWEQRWDEKFMNNMLKLDDNINNVI